MKLLTRILSRIGLVVIVLLILLLAAWRIDRTFFHPYQPEREEYIRDAVTTLKFSVPKDKESCIAKGGVWKKMGIRPFEECNLPTTDKGKPCTHSKECEGVCLAKLTDDMRKKGMRGALFKSNGFCSEYLKVLGCQAYVYNGWASVVCAD
jgi:hypothetical protein